MAEPNCELSSFWVVLRPSSLLDSLTQISSTSASKRYCNNREAPLSAKMLSITRYIRSSRRTTSIFTNRFLSSSSSVPNSASNPRDVLRGTEHDGSSQKVETWFLSSPSNLVAKTESQEPEFTPPSAPPLPSNAPQAVHQFHDFITAPAPSEASEVILPHTLEFFDTRSASAVLEASAVPESLPQSWENRVRVSGLREQNVKIVGKKEEVIFPEGDMIQGLEGSGPAWEWVGVVQVRGRGRGVVRRADGVVRRWVCLPIIPVLVIQ